MYNIISIPQPSSRQSPTHSMTFYRFATKSQNRSLSLVLHCRSWSKIIEGKQTLTFAFDTLTEKTVEQAATVVAEREDLVVVHRKTVRNVDTEALSRHLLRDIRTFIHLVSKYLYI